MTEEDKKEAADLLIKEIMRRDIPVFLKDKSCPFQRAKPGVGDALRIFADRIDAAARIAEPKNWENVR